MKNFDWPALNVNDRTSEALGLFLGPPDSKSLLWALFQIDTGSTSRVLLKHSIWCVGLIERASEQGSAQVLH